MLRFWEISWKLFWWFFRTNFWGDFRNHPFKTKACLRRGGKNHEKLPTSLWSCRGFLLIFISILWTFFEVSKLYIGVSLLLFFSWHNKKAIQGAKFIGRYLTKNQGALWKSILNLKRLGLYTLVENKSEIYRQSAPNNSNETYTFMGLGRAGHFGQS